MPSDVPTHADTKHPSRLKVLAVILIIWAVGASVSAAWIAYERAQEAQVRAWNLESIMLRHFSGNLYRVWFATDRLLVTGDYHWGTAAENSLTNTQFWLESPVADAKTFRTLGFTPSIFQDTWEAYVYANERIEDAGGNLTAVPQEVEYLSQVREIALSVSNLLNGVIPNGTSPLVQLGPERVESIATMMATVCDLSRPWSVLDRC